MGRTGHLRKQPAALPGNAGQKGEDMNTKKLMSDDRIDITATYLHGEVFSIQVYIKDSEGYVDKTVRVYYKSGQVEMQ